MVNLTSDQLKELLALNLGDTHKFGDIVAGKLSHLFPEEIIDVSIYHDVDNELATMEISGYQFSSDGKPESQHTIACIVLLDVLDKGTLGTAYKRACAINIPDGKRGYPVAVGSDIGGVSTFILSRTGGCSMQELSMEMVELNSKCASWAWPDAIGVCDRGVLNFCALIPGSGKTGSFFLPRGGDQDRTKGVPSVTVSLTLRASEKGVFAQVVRLIVARCGRSLRGFCMPNYELISPNFPRHGIAFTHYQFNLDGELKPQIFEQSLAAQLPGSQFLIESNNNKLGSIRLFPWQDGMVVKMSGEFPLEFFLMFLREVVPNLEPEQLQSFREGELQISHVLPITNDQFYEALKVFSQRSSNISVRSDTEKHLVQKVSDEGLSSKFISRLRFGVLALREAMFFENDERIRFDELYDDVYNDLSSVREARGEIVEAWQSHKQKFDSGEIIIREQRSIEITENIDRTIRRGTENLWNSAVRLVKQSMQTFLREYELETNFLFQKNSTFENGIEALQKMDPPLSDYLLQTRQWTEPLILLRNEELEHGQPIRLNVVYDISVEPPQIIQPTVSGLCLSEYVDFILDRCCIYVEDMVAHCIKQKLPSSLTITEIPVADRDDVAAIRFSTTIFPSEAQEWTIIYDTTSFDNR